MSEHLLVYVGTYTQTTGGQHRREGIYVFRMDRSTGRLTLAGTVSDVLNPMFLALDPSRRFLYTVNEVDEFAGQPGGGASAFAVDPLTGLLTALNEQLTHGADPCYISLDQAGRWALVANYSGGSATVLPIQADGRLGQRTEFVQHRGFGPNPQRQESAHVHSIQLDPTGHLALVADLGLDRVMLYRFDATQGTLTPHDPPFIACHPGAGPRHFEFHLSGRYLYVANELDSTVTAFAYDAAHGAARELQTLSTVPPDFGGENTGADIHITPSGRFLYASNRGHDSLAVFAVSPDDGTLAAVGHVPTGGQTPRNFAISPAGDLLLAANQDSDTLVAFRVDEGTGRLEPIGEVASVPAPVCVKIVEQPT